jgi:voltage-gated potassium channel Kch
MNGQSPTAVDEDDEVGDPELTLKGAGSVRRWLFNWLFNSEIEGNYFHFIERWVALLIIANLFALVFEHVPAIYQPYASWFHVFDLVSVGVFTVEYLMRLYLAPEDKEFKDSNLPRFAYARSPFALIDLVAILPFYLAAFIQIDLRMLRALRLLRILKLFRLLIPAFHEFQHLNAGRSFRQKLHALVWPSEYGGRLHDYFDTFIMVWVVVSVVAVVLESVASVHYVLNLEFIILDTIAVGVFSIEYLLRMYTVVESPNHKHAFFGRLKYAKTGNAIIDLLAVLPFFLEAFLHHLFDLRFLRVFRLLRLLKLTKYTGSTQTLVTVIVREWPVMSASVFIMMLLVVLTASLGYLFEHEAQPDKFEHIPASIYWAVITLASVGYGDISPVTPIGRAMTIILAILGIGIFAIPSAILASAFSDQLRIERETLLNELREIMKDGTVSEEEQAFIDQEAKRLHVSPEEVDRLLEEIRREQELIDEHAGIPLERLIATPALALLRFRELAGQVQQIALMTDKDHMDALIADVSKTDTLERAVWTVVRDDPARGTAT